MLRLEDIAELNRTTKYMTRNNPRRAKSSMKRTRLLAVVAALGLAAGVLGMSSANASAAAPPIAKQAAQQLRSDMTHHNVITIPLRLAARGSAPRVNKASKCASGDGVEVCFGITGNGLVLGSMLAGYRNISRGGFEAFDAIVGPDNFDIATSHPTLGDGDGLNIGWLQSTNSAAGNYCTGGFWVHGSQATQIGPTVCIDVIP